MQTLRAIAVVCVITAPPSLASARDVARGIVFVDQDGDGRHDPGESPLPDVPVSNGRDVVLTGQDGRYELPIDDDDIIFVIKPRGYMTPVDAFNLPRFFYIHKPAGSPEGLRYAGVAPTGPMPESIDFPLLQRDEPDTFRVILFGDPQPGTIKEVDYFAQDIVQEVIGADAAFGISLGDIVNDNLELFEPMAATVSLIGIPWYNVYGNHDQNYDVESDELADETWERVFGPPTYAFDWGPVHFIVLDDVMYEGNIETRRSHAELGPHLAFVENDLKHVPKDQLVVLMMHIPIVEVEDRQELFALLSDRPHTFSMSSHWHIQSQFFLGADDGWTGAEPHHHLVQGAACGSWWNGLEDEWGIPHTMMRDGVPNGYSIITFSGNQYSIRFKAARRSAEEQMAIHAPSSVTVGETGSTEVLANVYAGTERSQVEMRIGGSQSWLPMKQVETFDPYFVMAQAREEGLNLQFHQDLPNPQATKHIWAANLPTGLTVGSHLIEVRSRDMYGQVSFGRRLIRVVPPPSPPIFPPSPATVASVPHSELSLEKENPKSVRVMSYNMLWDGLFDRPVHFRRMLRAINPDIICFQEVRSFAPQVAAKLDAILPLPDSKWQAHEARGTVLASRWPLSMRAADTVPSTRRGQAMALVDLPDAEYDVDLYVISAHFKCCGSEGSPEDERRQRQADANINWFRDLRQAGGHVDLPAGTPFLIAGDFNIVGGLQPLNTLLDGNIINEDIYGADSPADWDGSNLADLIPVHNAGPASYTWRSDGSVHAPGRLDFFIYTDSVMSVDKSYVLNTLDMAVVDLASHGLSKQDTLQTSDHLPIVVDLTFGDTDDRGEVSAREEGDALRPNWAKDLVIYEVATKGFTSPNGPESGTFRSLQEKMAYLEELGINAIWLTGHSLSDPKHFYGIWTQYACVEPGKLDPSLGTEQDFKDMIAEAHRRGIRVFLDTIEHGVMNDSPLIAKHPDWFKGGSWGMTDYDWNGEHPDLEEWWVQMWTRAVLEWGVDGFRCDCGVYRPDLWLEIKRRCAAAGKPIFVLAENKRDTTSDAIQRDINLFRSRHGRLDDHAALRNLAGVRDLLHGELKGTMFQCEVLYQDNHRVLDTTRGGPLRVSFLGIGKDLVGTYELPPDGEPDWSWSIDGVDADRPIKNIQLHCAERTWKWQSNLEGGWRLAVSPNAGGLTVSGGNPLPGPKLRVISPSCHDCGWEGFPAGKNSYTVQGSRFVFGYGVLFAPAIPLFMSGDEFDADFKPLPGLCPDLYGKGQPGTGTWLYGSWLQWDQLKDERHGDMLKDVKRMLAIRRAHRDLIHAVVPDKVDIRLSAVPTSGHDNLPIPYALSNGKRALLVVGNPTALSVDVELKITPKGLGLPVNTKMLLVSDLWPRERRARRMTIEELSHYRCTVPADRTPGGGLRVFRFELPH